MYKNMGAPTGFFHITDILNVGSVLNKVLRGRKSQERTRNTCPSEEACEYMTSPLKKNCPWKPIWHTSLVIRWSPIRFYSIELHCERDACKSIQSVYLTVWIWSIWLLVCLLYGSNDAESMWKRRNILLTLCTTEQLWHEWIGPYNMTVIRCKVYEKC